MFKPSAFTEKSLLILLGIFLSLIFLEAGLRLGGFIFLSVQDRRNTISLSQKSTCTILCLGESTTALGGAYSYPSQLERILNSSNRDVKFSVINKGVPGIHTDGVCANLAGNLDKYKPDIVIAMIGINDQIVTDGNFPGKMNFFKELKVCKLAYLIWLHAKAKMEEIKNNKGGGLSFNVFRPSDLYAGEDLGDYNKTGWAYFNQKKYTQAEEQFKKVLEFDPQDDGALFGLGACYSRQERFEEAELILKKAIEINPGNFRAYIELGGCNNWKAKHAEAEEYFKKALEINPDAEDAYRGLGWSYELQKKYPQAEEYFKKALEINPKNYFNCVDFGLLCSLKGKYSQAEKFLNLALELKPDDDIVYANLGLCYKLQKKYPEAEGAFKKALELNPSNEKAYGGLAELYEEKGQPEIAKIYRQKAKSAQLKYYSFSVLVNYLKIKDMLDRRKIKLVCVQYPNRSVDPLKNIFKGKQGVIFVDNEKIFREAISKDGWKVYFQDAFAGDFGHCTPKGNKLLAGNVAKTILEEIYNYQQNKGSEQ